MAVTEIHVEASPQRCFEVLSDPRSFAYWVVGSRRVRAADPGWPEVGSGFDHSVGVGPLVTHDHTEVEEVAEPRLLVLRAKARPFGTAIVRMELEPEGSGARVRIIEEPGDAITAKLFSRLADRVLHARNAKALERLKALAEGTAVMPEGELPGRETAPGEGATGPHRGVAVGSPGPVAEVAAGIGRGLVAGLVGGAAMSASTALEMRLTGRSPSAVPARAIERLLAIRELGPEGERRVTALAHLLTSGAIGAGRGALSPLGVRAPYGAPLFLGLAIAPDFAVVPALGLAPPPWRWTRGELAISLLHHGVFAATAATALSRLER